jgi:hypothetical protein
MAVLVFPPEPPATPRIDFYRKARRAFETLAKLESEYPNVLLDIQIAGRAQLAPLPLDDWILSAKAAELRGPVIIPLAAGKSAANYERNWVALFLREMYQ